MSEVVTVYRNVSLVAVECYRCGIIFGLEYEYNSNRLDDKKDWYCPNGHAQHYTGKTEADKLRERLAEQERRTSSLREDLRYTREQRDAAERRRAAAQGQVTKIKKRVGNGVCPCCNRTFANVARHMASQHPDYAETAG